MALEKQLIGCGIVPEEREAFRTEINKDFKRRIRDCYILGGVLVSGAIILIGAKYLANNPQIYESIRNLFK